MNAMLQNDVGMIAAIIASGVDLNKVEQYDNSTWLTRAVRWQNVNQEIIALLVEFKANVNQIGYDAMHKQI